ncbi:unnamed protein product [Rhizoctonia solani]|uniref:DUF676 domain-containing protein n=1 Tax=Rhizoctonia solani TaxID=456999 RepID=A0A8H3GSA5_9AGAM|nr:unnamed protein product [Rhizoctonia solani]
MEASSSQPRNVHFLALVHGMWGNADHLKAVEESILKRFSDVESDTELVTLRVQTNANSHTYDGLDWGAERAINERIEEVEADGSKKVTKFSIFGYSLGGLISRYAIGILYQRGFFRTVKPINFTTFATPHLGLPRLRGFIGGVMHKLGPKMLSRTGQQFYGMDKDIWSSDDKEGRPLLEVMADQSGCWVVSRMDHLLIETEDSIFFKALKSFPQVSFYGNAVNDLTVVYCSSMAEEYDPFAALQTKSHRLGIKMDPKYKHVIESYEEVPAGEEVPMSDIDKAEKARRAALHWYSPERYRTTRPFLPPFLQFPFPLNLILYLCLPFLIPAGLGYAVVRFKSESRSSQRRLQALLESPDSHSALSAMMRKMEMAVADMVDPSDPGVAEGWEADMDGQTMVFEGGSNEDGQRRKATPSLPETGARSLPTPPTELDRKLESKTSTLPKPNPDDPLQPMLTPSQRAMAKSLSSIPQLRKVRAYFPYVRNAHSVIIVRDPKLFPIHLDGMGVVQHWVDQFML